MSRLRIRSISIRSLNKGTEDAPERREKAAISSSADPSIAARHEQTVSIGTMQHKWDMEAGREEQRSLNVPSDEVITRGTFFEVDWFKRMQLGSHMLAKQQKHDEHDSLHHMGERAGEYPTNLLQQVCEKLLMPKRTAKRTCWFLFVLLETRSFDPKRTDYFAYYRHISSWIIIWYIHLKRPPSGLHCLKDVLPLKHFGV